MTEVVNELLIVEVENQADEKTVLSTSAFPWSWGSVHLLSLSCNACDLAVGSCLCVSSALQ